MQNPRHRKSLIAPDNIMRDHCPRRCLNIFTRATISRRRAPISCRRCEQDLAVRLFPEPVAAETVEGCFEVVEDDGVAEAFEDEG